MTEIKPLNWTPKPGVGMSVVRRGDGGMTLTFTDLSDATLSDWRAFAMEHLLGLSGRTRNLYDLRSVKEIPEKAIRMAVEANSDPSARDIRVAAVVADDKVANAVHLRFDINASSLPEDVRQRLLKLNDQRISKDGVVIIKAQEFRSLEGNRAEAMRRLHELIDSVAVLPKRRRPTKPTRSSVKKRLESKTRRASIKAGRGKVSE